MEAEVADEHARPPPPLLELEMRPEEPHEEPLEDHAAQDESEPQVLHLRPRQAAR